MTRYQFAEQAKAAYLDADRTTQLPAAVAEAFARQMSEVLNSKASQWLDAPRMQVLAELICQDRIFPFRAECAQGRIVVQPDLHKQPDCVVKDISDGLSQLCQSLVEALMRRKQMPEAAETFKFAFPTLLHPALREAYAQSGLEAGPHTKYLCRG